MAEFCTGYHVEKLAKEYERRELSAMKQSVGEISMSAKRGEFNRSMQHCT